LSGSCTDAQVDVQHGYGGGSNTRNSASLTERLRANTLQLLLDLGRQSWNLRELKFSRYPALLGIFQPINLALLLRDVAGMLRSFHYAAHAVLYGKVAGIIPAKESTAILHKWAGFWYRWVGSVFLHGYLQAQGVSSMLMIRGEELRILLDAYLVERGLIEVLSDLQNRPEWTRIPIVGLLEILGPEP